MLLPLIEVALLTLLVSLLIRLTLTRLDRASQELERIGHPFTLWNWMNLSGLRFQHRQKQLGSARDYLESVASLSKAKQLVHNEILRLMEHGHTFESAARAVLLEETEATRSPSGGQEGEDTK